MPELPEVETIVRGLRPRIVGRRITGAALSHPDILAGVSAARLLRELRGRTIVAVERRAKHALIVTDTKILAVQPGMSGSLIHYRRALTAAEHRYAVLRCTLDDGTRLVYRDIRRIGTIRWVTPAAWAKYAARLGPEPLDPAFTAGDFAARLGRSASPIKKVLMDQRFVVGVGNIYANEALFAAGIDPSMRARDVPATKLRRLHHEVRRVLQLAIDREGSSIRNYVTGTGESGSFQTVMKVYGRAGQSCLQCGTTLTETHEIDGRSTVFCWRCQKSSEK
ncbi:MAG: bifunctional DNA-formamidopyrimidine glycosylase/DNA-(apurinic or apyrimidinic site) lyase [Gemmatimonadales bacterium]